MDLGRAYLTVALRLRRLVPGWVDSYAGPADLLEAVQAEGGPSPDGVRESAEALAACVAGDEHDSERRAWLLAQLRGISTALRHLAGERLDYSTLFERCHGAAVTAVPDGEFERAHALLDRALPGSGPVGARYRAWRAAQVIPAERLHGAVDLLAEEMRRRCRERFALPDGEVVRWQLVCEETWAGHAEYLGQRRTLVRINTDYPISAHRLLELVCHEAYPGHHAEHACKEALGREELSVFVYPTPQALIAEGIACNAIEALLGEAADAIAAECLRPAGIPYDHLTAAAAREAEALLVAVRSNAALMLDAGAGPPAIHEYAQTWMLDDPQRVREAMTHLLEDRAWRPYESCYPVGRALCRRYAAGDPARFARLLHRQLTPADLAV
jgi:hypothetical protein